MPAWTPSGRQVAIVTSGPHRPPEPAVNLRIDGAAGDDRGEPAFHGIYAGFSADHRLPVGDKPQPSPILGCRLRSTAGGTPGECAHQRCQGGDRHDQETPTGIDPLTAGDLNRTANRGGDARRRRQQAPDQDTKSTHRRWLAWPRTTPWPAPCTTSAWRPGSAAPSWGQSGSTAQPPWSTSPPSAYGSPTPAGPAGPR